MQGQAEEDNENHQPSLSELLDKAAHNHPEATQKIKTECPVFIEYSDEQIQLINSGAQQPQISVGEDLLEMAKITGMVLLAAVFYGINRDLTTAIIDPRYFSYLDLNPFSWVAGNHYIVACSSNMLIALLSGINSTWWLGLPFGVVTALVARYDTYYEKLSWYDLSFHLSKLTLGSLVYPLFIGAFAFIITSSRRLTIGAMRNWSYTSGLGAGGALIVYSSQLRSSKASP